jgi:hypothetical protein
MTDALKAAATAAEIATAAISVRLLSWPALSGDWPRRANLGSSIN